MDSAKSTSEGVSPYSVTLPVAADQLRDFVSGLLGKPQTISRAIVGPFQVRRTDIEDVYHLLEQRVSAQNKASLINFTVKIVYDDRSSVQLNSLAQFRHYNEVKPLASTAVHLSWTYLVRFENKEIHEKQQIDLSITTGEADRTIDIDAELSRGIIVGKAHQGAMYLRISHTDRTWASDIDALLTGRLAHLQVEEVGVRRFFSVHSGRFGGCTAIAILALGIYGIFATTKAMNDRLTSSIDALGAATQTIPDLSKQVAMLSKFVIDSTTSGFVTLTTTFLILLFIGAGAAGITIAITGEYEPRSFLLLTRKDEENHSRAERARDRSFAAFLFSVPSTLVLGVAANYLYYLLAKALTLH